MTVPKDMTTCSTGASRDRKPEPIEARITIQRVEGGSEQLAAWRRLWVKLLAAPTPTAAADRPKEGKAIVHRSNEQVGYQERER